MEDNIWNFNWTGKYFYVDFFPMMSNPYPLILIFIIYLLFVLKLGPMYMKNRTPYDITDVLRLYNVFQVFCCTFIVASAFFYHGYSFSTFSKCIPSPSPVTPDDKVNLDLVKFHIDGYLFMLLRLFELIETIFFVLRKKFNQVSLLHMYHHISTITLVWLFLKYRGGKMEMFIPVINSFVHIIMYTYYFLSSFKRFSSKTAFIKPAITIIQIVQLVMILVQCIAITLCETSNLNYALVVNFVINIVLFSHFFVKTYLWKSKKPPVQNNNNSPSSSGSVKSRPIASA